MNDDWRVYAGRKMKRKKNERSQDEYRRVLRMMEVVRLANLRIERQAQAERDRKLREVDDVISELAK